ncbi:MAG TPA: sigma-70 family RNA polymerase sigma factor [Pyrinomonadaceae bacterium]|nr:sigma-70 family RNA polymerase sigma factor [Pyrinomonadaceae bacterium]
MTFLRLEDIGPSDSPVLAFFKNTFGFVPNVFRDQMLRTDIVQAEAKLIDSLLLKQRALTRFQKECILLVVSAANSNAYSVALFGQTLQILGTSSEESDRIAIDYQGSKLSEANKALVTAVKKLVETPTSFCEDDIASLASQGFTQEQILESILVTGLANFLNTVQIGLGALPDFPQRIVFPLKKEVNLSSESGRQTIDRPLSEDFPCEDPDTEIVARVQAGETDAFEELVRKHGRRIYRSLVGILGSADEAEDAMQDVFMKAFQHIGDFERRSRFSTWLVRIAINTAIQRVRGRKEISSLEEEDGEFRPRNIQAWQPDPEQCCSKEEMRRLIEKEIIKLPMKYRLVLILRDVEELSTVEAANALGLGVPALKARLVRGRLMLREALVPYFSKENTGVTA